MIYLSSQVGLGLTFFIYLIGIVALSLFLPVIGYRIYALYRSGYFLSRDGIRIKWGLRTEDIPIEDISWLYFQENLDSMVVFPHISLPGSVIGSRRNSSLGDVEFFASKKDELIFIGIINKTFAISPIGRDLFFQTFQDLFEAGSLFPIEAQSIHPSFLITQIFKHKPSFWMIISSVVLNLGLIFWTGIVINQQEFISLGFSPYGSPNEPVYSTQLILLPLISLFFLLFDFSYSLYFYRREKYTYMYMLLIASSLTTILVLLAQGMML